MKKQIWTLLLLIVAVPAAAQRTAPQLIEMARRGGAGFQQALVETLGQENIQKGTAFLGEGESFLWAVESADRPALLLNGDPGPALLQIEGSNIWYTAGDLTEGTSHEFVYMIRGQRFGGSKNVPAYGPDSYAQDGVPKGKLSEQFVHTSTAVYPGLRSNYWVYVPAQYDPGEPAALMVWQDGHNYNQRDGNIRLLDVVDNLIHQEEIPVMIQVFVSPGDITQAPESTTYKEVMTEVERRAARFRGRGRGGRGGPRDLTRMVPNTMRSIEYDTVSDRYARFLRDELLPEIEAKYNIRKDGYSRAIAGLSSGGICAFNVAWQQPGQFSRVLSWIGSFVALIPEPDWGGQAFPAKVQNEEKRNIRVWLQDGAEDNLGWPEQNIQLANSLKRAGYDFHFSYGVGTHSPAQGSAELPQSLIWLWRDYDPNLTQQEYVQDEDEQEKPYFRFQIHNRDHDADY